MKPRQGDRVVVLIGKTGVGKSTFIYYVTGKNHKSINTRTLNPCTTAVEFVEANPSLGGSPVIFMDTPGLDASADSDEVTLAEIASRLQQLYRDKVKLAGVLYLCRISDNRFNKSSMDTLKLVANICGPQAMSNLTVVTTMWSEVAGDTGTKREKQLREDFCKEILGQECRMARFDTGRQAAWSIVNGLLGISPTAPLAIQTELEDKKLALTETAAGIQQKKSKQDIPGGLLYKLRRLFRKSR
ncbi:hypothetical protein CPB86DRAFT_262090 [Serendipita vermifera]|nr:hypothetical protein CPB86DRAFT_262090 [Serendipita vermifera]